MHCKDTKIFLTKQTFIIYNKASSQEYVKFKNYPPVFNQYIVKF